jgi:hypothetical protein
MDGSAEAANGENSENDGSLNGDAPQDDGSGSQGGVVAG